jgi:NADPH:quinone reductase-like Zn-dependent oxidoreductase
MVPYDNISMRLAIGYAAFLTLLWIGAVFNKRIAFGIPREVNYDEEVILITGGASGLGRLIADFYAMRGASVAVLDVKKADDDEMMGIEYHHCDVSDEKQVIAAVAKINDSVCSCNSTSLFFALGLFVLHLSLEHLPSWSITPESCIASQSWS